MKTKKPLLITPEQPVLVLRISNADGSSRNGFIWPAAGPVTCPDWQETAECGNGLHGWLRGEGDHSAANGNLFTNPDSLWLAVLVPAYVELEGKVKFPAGEVVCSGDRLTVTEYLKTNGCDGALIGGTATAGYAGTATAGDAGTATAGDAGTATAGSRGTATAGSRGTATAGDAGTATAGSRGTATAGYAGTATAGSRGTATAGYAGTATAGDAGTATAGDAGTATAGYAGTATAGLRGTATAGYAGTATAGYAGTATAGDAGTATAGYAGTATAGDAGAILIRYWNGKRYRFSLGNIGEDNDATGEKLKANRAYKLNDAGKFILA